MYCNIHPLEGETFVDAIVRTTTKKERMTSGLALKVMLARLQGDKEAEVEAMRKLNEINKEL